VTIAAVGDTMLGNTPDLPPQPGSYLDAVRQQLSSGAQIVFGNLEGTLTTVTGNKCANTAPGECFAFRDPPEYVQYLKAAGFTIFSHANPHSYDFGAAGQEQTVRTLHDAGLAQTGLPGQITTVTARGVKVAFVAFAPYSDTANLLDISGAQALIRKASGRPTSSWSTCTPAPRARAPTTSPATRRTSSARTAATRRRSRTWPSAPGPPWSSRAARMSCAGWSSTAAT
jgi:hypothetical protein